MGKVSVAFGSPLTSSTFVFTQFSSRIEQVLSDMEQPSSNIFEGYKSVGCVTGPLPFIVRHGKNPQDTRIITIVGRTFHTYTTNLSLVEVSIPHEKDVKTVIADERNIFSASGRSILIWGRGSKKLIQRLDNGHQSDVQQIVKFGVNKLLSLDEDNVLFHWSIKEKEILNILSLDEGAFKISAICHPFTYKDKILLGSKQGQLQLWNVSSEQCLYKFEGWGSEVTCINQSPVVDVLGIGLDDGHVYVLNIKYDEVLVKIYQEYGPITSMSFRLDGQPYLVTASDMGHLMIWNLERKRLSSQIRNAHNGRISKCQFVRNESLLVTAGCDNSVKIWTMDMSDGCGTLLSQRSGHSEPPSYIRFYGPKGFNLLSAGNDSSLKMFHMYSERLNRNLGTARYNPKSRHKKDRSISKLPPISCFAAETSKEKQWDNIVACHKGTSLVTTWNYDKCRMGEHFIAQPSYDKHGVHATTVSITSCGNFCVIGYSNGIIYKYNLQSGIFRQTYETSELSDHRAHDGPVVGLTVDGLDIVLISAGQDSALRLWNFKTGILLLCTRVAAPICKIELHRENNLLAMSMANNQIEIMDLETRTTIRKFSSNSKLLDMTFSPDSRWLIASFEDKSIRTWDLSLGKLIDSFRLSSSCISLSVSSTGEFLATAHDDSLSINIWCNHTIYHPAAFRTIDESKEPPVLDMPFVRCDESIEDNEESEDQALAECEDYLELEYVSPDQLHDNLITMSGLPSSRWKNLLNIEEIREKQRIQDEEKRVKPSKVPFFIPVKAGLKPKVDLAMIEELNRTDKEASENASKIQNLQLLSPLIQSLLRCASKSDYEPFISELKELGPSATDAEIRSMGSDTCGNNQAMLCFLEAMKQRLYRNADFELINSWLSVFLKAHSGLIMEDAEVRRQCLELSKLFGAKWDRLKEEFNQIFCVLNFVRSSIL